MSIPVALMDLMSAARERGPSAYVLTVNEAGAPHVVHAEVIAADGRLAATVGTRTARFAGREPRVSVLYPCRGDGDYSLIVDALATVEGTTPEGTRLVLTPTRAVLHRPVAAPDPSTSPCGSDCVPLAIDAASR